ncbi:MAG: hypothetical protein Q9169_002373 [Polycauliona sp. 2 TL-2023]
MHHLSHLLLFLLSPLLILAQTTKTPVAAIREASAQYSEILARLTEVNSDCERTTINPASCTRVFGEVAEDIAQANDQLDIAAQNFVPKVPCQTIAVVFYNVRYRFSHILLLRSLSPSPPPPQPRQPLSPRLPLSP